MAILGYVPFYLDGVNVFNLPLYETSVVFTQPGGPLSGLVYGIDSLATVGNSYVDLDFLHTFPIDSEITTKEINGRKIGVKIKHSAEFFRPYINGSPVGEGIWIGDYLGVFLMKLSGNSGRIVPFQLRSDVSNNYPYEVLYTDDQFNQFENFPTELEIVQNSRPAYTPDPEEPEVPDVPEEPEVPDVPEEPEPLPPLTRAGATAWFQLGQSVRRMMGNGEQWETVWEGTAESVRGYSFHDDSSLGYVDHNGAEYNIPYSKTPFIFDGDTLRITVDGVPVVYHAAYVSTSRTTWVYAGNLWLRGRQGYDDYPNTGEDFLVYQTEYYEAFHGVIQYLFGFHTRNPGTYNVKIERLVN